MTIELTSEKAVFSEDIKIAGVCVLNDPFKPYLDPMLTPNGHSVTQAMPVDHRHHKGLMYALRCADLDFWAERKGTPLCGVQRIVKTSVEKDTLTLDLIWHRDDGEMETYRERRQISCRYRPAERGFAWTWKTHREALRDHHLIKSEWSKKLPDGRTVNYHGLGIRFPWAWAFPKESTRGIEINGKAVTDTEALASDASEITFWGKFDGYWAHPTGAVTMRQNHGFGLFALNSQGFSTLAMGPTTREELHVRKGDIFDETYEVLVQDR